ncbi:MAG: hypothetical protein QOI51_1728, partial [Nocardioidaceae bacterium]|nr:hypothetical protein [Nocardioidaceae bacterium]
LHRHRIVEQINGYAARHVAMAHPDADAARQAEHAASVAFEAAQKARTRLDNALYTELRPYGRAAHITDPGQRLTIVIDQLAVVEHALAAAMTRVAGLHAEPAIRALSSGGLNSERNQWSADRAARREAAARETRARWQRQQAPRIGPNHHGHPTRDQRPSIGR